MRFLCPEVLTDDHCSSCCNGKTWHESNEFKPFGDTIAGDRSCTISCNKRHHDKKCAAPQSGLDRVRDGDCKYFPDQPEVGTMDFRECDVAGIPYQEQHTHDEPGPA